MPLMIKLNRNVVRVYLCLDNGRFITVVQLIKHIETPTMFATRSIVPFTIRKRQSVKEMNKEAVTNR